MKDYENIKTPQELLTYMDNINYGFTDSTGNNYGSWDEKKFEENVFKKWTLSSPERLIKVKHGHCFDQVELERDWFTKHNYIIHTYYIMFVLPYENPYTTHTFLIYEENSKYYYFEHSDYYNRGIIEFDSLEEALLYRQRKQISSNKEQHNMTEEEISSLKIFEYSKPPYGITMDDFITLILKTGQEIDLTPYIINEYIKQKIAAKEYSILPDIIANGPVYKIHKSGDLEKDGYEVSYLYLPKGSSIKEHKHTKDVERYKLIYGYLSVFNFPSKSNVCLLDHVHCIDEVPTDTIIETCKISKDYLYSLNYPEEIPFDKILKKVI